MVNQVVQQLMRTAPRGQPLDVEMLRRMDISPSQASLLAQAGWLQRLSRGAYLLAGDTPTPDGIIAFLSKHIPNLHAGGKTALNWHGVRHNIAFREQIRLWGGRPYDFPPWVVKYMPFTYQTTKLFDDALPCGKGLKPLPNGNPCVLVSIPERALLELASDIGKSQSVEEAFNLVGMLKGIRPSVLDDFLLHCTRVKVIRLVRDLGLSSGYPWGGDLQKHVDRLGSGKRWSNKIMDGGRLNLKPK